MHDDMVHAKAGVTDARLKSKSAHPRASWLDFLQNAAFAPKFGYAAARLDGSPELRAHKVGVALRRTIRAETAIDEMTWQGRIETVRREMKSCKAELSFLDHGAGARKRRPGSFYPSTVRRSVAELCTSASKSRLWARLLFYLVRELKPQGCLELGTCLGISGSYLGAALKLNGDGRLTTTEAAVSVAERAQYNFSSLGLNNIEVVTGKFQESLPTTLARLAPIEFAFIDGHHDGTATLRYFEQICSSAASQAVFVFDDIRWSGDMSSAWRTIQADSRVEHSVDLWSMGICLLSETAEDGGLPSEFMAG